MNAEDRDLKVAIYGTGKLSALLLEFAPASGLEIVAGVTTDPAKSGRDFGELLLGDPCGIPVTDDLESVLAGHIDVLLYGGHGGSKMFEVLDACADAGVDVVTSVSMFSDESRREDLESLERRAVIGGARIIGTGLVPGFRLDYMPVALASTIPDPVCVFGRHVSVISTWTEHVLVEEGGIGVRREGGGSALFGYLEEAFWSLVHGLGLELDSVERDSKQLTTPFETAVGGVAVPADGVIGFFHTITGTIEGNERVKLEWTSSREVPEDPAEGTELVVTGPRGLRSRIVLNLPRDGYPGTAARMIKAVRPLGALRPGIKRVHELSLR
ncbi:hypothetical protein AB4089_22525 [Arthrobacter sp. 2MCAF15]|uniref:hypothetical protein n=1 Tax=Arthrobacter sp. 2MCAF15 TaxID=3232984 RepID=UPI003F8DFFE8